MPEGHKYEHEKIQERLKGFDSRISCNREEIEEVKGFLGGKDGL